MKKKMVLVLILVLVVSNSMVAFGATDTKDRTAKSSDGNTWEYWNGATQDEGTNPKPNEQQVTASYSPNTTTVYNVDISWGNMNYSYKKDGDTTWDPEKHTYGTGTGTWSVTSSGTDDAVTVKNHSNVGVYATIKCEFESTYSNLKGVFIPIGEQSSEDAYFYSTKYGVKVRNPMGRLEIGSAINRGTTFEKRDNKGLPQVKVKFEIEGDPGRPLTNTKIGTITVTISN